ncbi:MAG: hypothetical protein A2X86_18370 [Bdellovibrionales bacterium GWA2_49_15]|nr:MAG: hypothetical protein A2X86_18370 [Bdellovibrionales bacterium GWA2_49_15]HAZ11690.1 hypothetical protein [Bdellovibrionales bacterium]
MNKIILLLFSLTLISFATPAKEIELRKMKFTENKFYAEFLAKNVSVHCTPADKEENNYKISYIIGRTADEHHLFVFRRPWSPKTCAWRKKEISKILRDNRIVRILGILRIESNYQQDKDDQGKLDPPLRNRRHYSWIFDRIDNGKGQCHGYFDSHEQSEGSCAKDRVENIIMD